MTELEGIGNVQEVPVEPNFIPPPVEEFIKVIVAMDVKKRDDGFTVIYFHSPFKTYVMVVNDDICNYLIENIRPSRVKLATLADMPR